MPRFIANGPDVPERLLQAHEDGRVVFFSGAGISYPAGLPDFRGLVNQLYLKLGTTRDPIEEKAYQSNLFDATLDLLERRYPGQRLAVRTALASVLKPNLRKKGATTTHKALLDLATDRSGKVRLVTTNFDRIFQHVISRRRPSIPIFAAPLLPIAKPYRWHGVVHLHGLLPAIIDDTALNRLVVTSGDFGLAYLTERWAARFVSDLFSNYTVCFVGYSINDPVLRYMMDALAVDEMLGEARPEAYAFGSFMDGGHDQSFLEWKAKGVTPLLYRVPTGTRDHSSLHLTLKEWADTYRDGVRGKEMIVAQHATAPPLAPSRSDFAVGRLLWALTDGLAAKHFADLNPVPPLAWLEPLATAQFGHADLPRFGVAANAKVDDKLIFSFLRRPAPYLRAPWMALVDTGFISSQWDDVMLHLARWLTRHLDDPQLVLWFARAGGQLQERLGLLIEDQLEAQNQLERDGKSDDLARIRANAPNAIARPMMRTLWRFVLTGRLKSHAHFHLYDWVRRVGREPLTSAMRFELRQMLTPCVALREPSRWRADQNDLGAPERIADLVDWEIVLSADHAHSALGELRDKPRWREALPDLLGDFTTLLRDALDLMRELGGIDDQQDLSYLHQPSISEHPQNQHFRDWTALIDLTRDAWLATAESTPERAQLIADNWRQISYPLFRRLTFFAAAQGTVIPYHKALDCLIGDGGWWLWSPETQREAMRLLVAIASRLDARSMAELEQAILNGPPRSMFRDDIEPERWTQTVDREVWLRLAKLDATGITLSEASQARLAALTTQYPSWQLAADERDEFPTWMGSGEDWRTFVVTPRRRRELVEWLKEHPAGDYWQEDDWRERCREDFATSACALCALAQEGIWPIDRWRDALQVWSEDDLLHRSWRYMAPVVVSAPDQELQSLVHGVSWWLRSVAKTFAKHESIFFSLSRRVLAINYQDKPGMDDLVMHAINHPVGHVTEALLRWWYRQSLKEGQGLAEQLKPIFTEICDTQTDKFRSGRVLLAKHAIALYRVDRDWTTAHTLPLFDWKRSEIEARNAWEGFLWSPRLYRPFLEGIKTYFLDTADHYASLGKHDEQYVELLTFAALDRGDTFSVAELATAMSALPADALGKSAQALARAIEGAGDQREEYWRNRILPFLRSIWPKSLNLISAATAEGFARLCIASKELFPQVVEEVKHWLKALPHPDFVVHLLSESGLIERFPEASLAFLDATVGDDAQWMPRDLATSVEEIGRASPPLQADPRFLRLQELSRRR